MSYAGLVTRLGEELNRMLDDSVDLNEKALIVHCGLMLLLRDHSDLSAITHDRKHAVLERILAWRREQGG